MKYIGHWNVAEWQDHMICPDCKGSKVYEPLVGPAEPCRRCEGIGDVPDSSDEFKRDALELCQEDRASLRFKYKEKPAMMPSIGDEVYVYDNRWYEYEVASIEMDDTLKCQSICRSGWLINISFKNLAWNETQGRWESILCGTPVWS